MSAIFETVVKPYDEVNTLLSYIESLPQDIYTYAVRFHFCFNLRIGELRALTWDDVNMKDETLCIHHQIIKASDGTKRTWFDVSYTKCHKETGIRMLPISEEAVKILKSVKVINGSKHYIFQGMNGAKWPVSEERFNDHLRRYCEAWGVTYHSSHKVRYLGITKMYEAGIDESEIQRSAGHASIDMTRKYIRDRRRLQVSNDDWEKIFGRNK